MPEWSQRYFRIDPMVHRTDPPLLLLSCPYSNGDFVSMMRLSAALALVIDTEAPFEYPHAWQNVSGSQKRTNGSQNVKYSHSHRKSQSYLYISLFSDMMFFLQSEAILQYG